MVICIAVVGKCDLKWICLCGEEVLYDFKHIYDSLGWWEDYREEQSGAVKTLKCPVCEVESYGKRGNETVCCEDLWGVYDQVGPLFCQCAKEGSDKSCLRAYSEHDGEVPSP